MSLVNDVLRDLQTRQTQAAHPLQGLRPTATGSRRRRGIGVAAMSALVVLGLSAWRMADVQRPDPVVALAHTPAALVPVAAATADQPRPVGLRLASVQDFAGSRRAQPVALVTRATVIAVAAVPAVPAVAAEPVSPAPFTAAKTRVAGTTAARTAAQTTMARTAAPTTVASAGPSTEQPASESFVAEALQVRTTPPADPAETAFRRGVALLAAGDAQTARTALAAAVGFDPGRTIAWQHLATAHQSAGQPQRAVAVLREALGVADDPDTLRLLLARLLVDEGRIEAALAVLDPALAAPARHPSMAGFRAALLQRAGLHDQSAELYETLVAMRPGEGAWWMGLAISRETLGETGAALTAYRRAAGLADLPAPLADYAGLRIAGLTQPSH